MKSITKEPNPLRLNWLPLVTKRSMKKDNKHFIESLDKIDNNVNPSLFEHKSVLNYDIVNDTNYVKVGAYPSYKKNNLFKYIKTKAIQSNLIFYLFLSYKSLK